MKSRGRVQNIRLRRIKLQISGTRIFIRIRGNCRSDYVMSLASRRVSRLFQGKLPTIFQRNINRNDEIALLVGKLKMSLPANSQKTKTPHVHHRLYENSASGSRWIEANSTPNRSETKIIETFYFLHEQSALLSQVIIIKPLRISA